MDLTPRQLRFVQEYLVDLNATAAAKRAGYSARTADRQGWRLLNHAKVKEAIAVAQAQRAQVVSIDSNRILKEYCDLAFNDLREVFEQTPDGTLRIKPIKDWPESIGRSMASIKVRRYTEGHGDDAREVEVVEFKLWPKTDALEKLAQHKNLLGSNPSQPTNFTIQIVNVEAVRPPLLTIEANGSSTNGNHP